MRTPEEVSIWVVYAGKDTKNRTLRLVMTLVESVKEYEELKSAKQKQKDLEINLKILRFDTQQVKSGLAIKQIENLVNGK